MSEETSIIEYDEDISNAEPPAPLPEGEYQATISGTQVRVSGQGNHYVEVMFRVDPDDFPADYPVEESPDGAMLAYRRVPVDNTKSARYRMRRFCETIGAPCGTRVDVNEWVGLSATIVVKHEEYEGEMRAQIVNVKTD